MSLARLFILTLGIASIITAFQDFTPNQVFTNIYDEKLWGINEEGIGYSGNGSRVETTQEYRQFIQTFLETYDIHSVVDIGCGDWSFSYLINWVDINYLGIDVVESVIKRNEARYTSDHIHFICANCIEDDIPAADLLICKDILQHLTNADIIAISRHFNKFKYCLITNGVDPYTHSSTNYDIQRGDYRPIDLTQFPFFIEGKKIFAYEAGTFDMQTLLIVND